MKEPSLFPIFDFRDNLAGSQWFPIIFACPYITESAQRPFTFLKLASLAVALDLLDDPRHLGPCMPRIGEVVHLAEAIFLQPNIVANDLFQYWIRGMQHECPDVQFKTVFVFA